jgi:hypothetical protein
MIGAGIIAAWGPFWRAVSFLSSIDFMRTASGRPGIGTYFLPPGLADLLMVVGIGLMVFVFVSREMQGSPHGYSSAMPFSRPDQEPPAHHEPPPLHQEPSGHRSEERLFVDRTPQELMRFREEHTSVNANKLLEVFMGKWLRVPGIFEDVAVERTTLFVTLVMPTGTSRSVAFLYFQLEWHDRLLMLKRGAPITVIGRIVSVGLGEVVLTDCELETAPAQP